MTASIAAMVFLAICLAAALWWGAMQRQLLEDVVDLLRKTEDAARVTFETARSAGAPREELVVRRHGWDVAESIRSGIEQLIGAERSRHD